MESSTHFLGAEGCSSSESGWTMYIASPMHERDSECSGNDDGDDNNVHITNYNYCDGKDEGSDDSMASDASSGPNHQASENGQDSNGMATAPFKHDKDDNINKYSSWKKGNKQEKKKGEGGSSKKEKKDLMLRRNTTSSHTQRGAR